MSKATDVLSVENGNAAIKTYSVSGTMISKPSATDTTAIVEDSNGEKHAVKKVVDLSGGGSGGVTVHNQLTGRDTAECHPISAIKDLQTTLDTKAPVSTTYTKTEVDKKIADSIGAIETALAEV